jgi:predicted ATP-grasp superfamily ATP-dependent carboligase
MPYQSLVIGNDHHNSLGVIESLGMKGILSFLIIVGKKSNSFVATSRFVIKTLYCEEIESLTSCILNDLPLQNKYIVISTSDDVALELNNNLNALLDSCIIPGINEEKRLIEVMNKQEMVRIAQDAGFFVPTTFVLERGEAIPDTISFPVIAKSLISAKNGKSELMVIHNAEEFSAYCRFNMHSPSVQIQSFISKSFEFQLLGLSLNDGNEIIIPGHTVINRPTGIDNTCFLSFEALDETYNDVLSKAKSFIQTVKYSGLFSMEFIRGVDGKDYFLEMNYRNDGNAIAVTYSGVNLPFIWYLYNSETDYSQEINDVGIKNIHLIPEYFDLMRVFYFKEISFGEWLKNMREADCYTTFFRNDRRPFRLFLLQNFTSLIRSVFRKVCSCFHKRSLKD